MKPFSRLVLLALCLSEGRVIGESLSNNLSVQKLSSVDSDSQENAHRHFSSSYNPREWSFSYIVEDTNNKLYMTHKERKTEKGIKGCYEVKLPDGRIQIVNYEADNSGYKPVVKYKQPVSDYLKGDLYFNEKPVSESSTKPELFRYENPKINSFINPVVNIERSFPVANSDHTQKESINNRKMKTHLDPFQEKLQIKPTKAVKEKEDQKVSNVFENLPLGIRRIASNRYNTIPSNNIYSKYEIDYDRSKEKYNNSKSETQEPITSVSALRRSKTSPVSTLLAKNFESLEIDESEEKNIFGSENYFLPNTDSDIKFVNYDNNILGKNLIPHLLRYRVYVPY